VVGLIVSGTRDETERQRMVAVDGAKAARGGRDRNLQAFGEFQQFLGSATIAYALPDQHHRPIGTEQQIDCLDHAYGVGAAAA